MLIVNYNQIIRFIEKPTFKFPSGKNGHPKYLENIHFNYISDRSVINKFCK